MHLTREEERIYEGESGDTLQRSMEILVALGDIYDANELIPIASAQIAGVSYKTIGEAGLEWVADLSGKVAVPSILNPAGMDLHRWSEMGILDDFALMQQSVIEAYRKLGIAIDCTCTPYQVHPNMVHAGDHLAWSESSAVAFANSVIGARTNREGGPSALAAAFLGKTPHYGYHLDENRIPTHRVHVDMDLKGSDYGALGVLIGDAVKDGIPLIRVKGRPTAEELKALGAAMAASGSVALFYIDGPAAPYPKPDMVDKISIGAEEIEGVYERYSPDEDVDIVAIGCPHCSKRELLEVADLISGKKVKRELWICTARGIKESCPDLIAKIEKSGAKVICDTCMVVSPASENYNKMMVNSGKALTYIPGLCKIRAAFGSVESCIETAIK